MLRLVTVIWGILGIGFACMMLKARSVLDVWWTMSGIFGGGILGLFLLALMKVKLKMWQGIVSIVASILFISWGVFIRTEAYGIPKCKLDKIIIGALGTVVLVLIACALSLTNKGMKSPDADADTQTLELPQQGQ